MVVEVIKKPLYHNLLRFQIVVNSYFCHRRNEGHRRGCDRRCEGLGGARRDASENEKRHPGEGCLVGLGCDGFTLCPRAERPGCRHVRRAPCRACRDHIRCP